ncbi:MAG: hypothetical protein A3F16_07770 [Deltaproteobacteria bacterium RIFCSPHIGHO2_12_FULL_43_9]|nr:MAG: hypothetical protein A3F16_07770 [Deltaproteobacteria bacterium RIFCSPHIGHO2_12_FULL_43_9]
MRSFTAFRTGSAISCAEIPSVAQPVLSEREGLPRNDVGDPSPSAQDDEFFAQDDEFFAQDDEFFAQDDGSKVPLNSRKTAALCQSLSHML